MFLITDTISSFLINIISSDIYQGKQNFFQRIRIRSFKKKLNREIESYLLSCDGTILVTGSFQEYFASNHICDKMFENIVGTISPVNKQELISSIFEQFENGTYVPTRPSATDKLEIIDFLSFIYNRIELFYHRDLSVNERQIFSEIRSARNTVLKGIQSNSADIQEIKELLKLKVIIDPLLTQKIYDVFAVRAWDGDLQELSTLSQLIGAQSPDLSFSAMYLIKLLTKEPSLTDPSELETAVTNEHIYIDLIQKTIFLCLFLDRKDLLSKIKSRNSFVNQIVHALLFENDSFFLQISIDSDSSVYCCKPSSLHPDFEWIQRRISALIVLKKDFFNTANVVADLLGDQMYLLDKLLFFNAKLNDRNRLSKQGNLDADSLFSEISQLETGIQTLNSPIKIKYYSILLRSAIDISTECAVQCQNRLSDNVLDDLKIQMLLMQIKIENRSASAQEVIALCSRSGEYWLVNNLFVSLFENDKGRILQIAQDNPSILSKDAGAFLIYVRVVGALKGRDCQIEVLNEYESIFCYYLDYWCSVNDIKGISPESLDTPLQFWRDKKLVYSSPNSLNRFIYQLYSGKKYDEVLEFTGHSDGIGIVNPLFEKYRGMSLVAKGQEIAAILPLTRAFNSLPDDDEVVYYLIVSLTNNKRPVSDSVYERAIKSNNPSLLMLAAICADQHGNHHEAMVLITRAIVSSKSDNIDVWGHYFVLSSKENIKEVRTITCVEECTAFVAKSVSLPTSLVVCVHSKNILPESPMLKDGVLHIDTESAIEYSFFKQKKGAELTWDGIQYTIEEIMPLEVYLFRQAMQKLIEAGKMQQIQIPIDESGKLETEKFMEQMTQILGQPNYKNQWLDSYNDIGSIALPLAFYEQFVKVTYLQLVNTMVTSGTVLFRNDVLSCTEYSAPVLLTFPVVVALYKIGFSLETSIIPTIIPCSLKGQFFDDASVIIAENKRDTVASLTFYDGQPLFIESSDDNKQFEMQSAIELKHYCEQFETAENVDDIFVGRYTASDLKKIFGVSDYDALAIAKKDGRSIVTTEGVLSVLAKEVNVSTIGLADFISDATTDILKFLSFLDKMVQFCFSAPLSGHVVDRVIKEYDNAEWDKREKITEKWITILEKPLSQKSYAQSLCVCFKEILSEKFSAATSELHPILFWLSLFTLRYEEDEGDLSVEMQNLK